MPLRQAEITQSSTVRWQFVSDDGIRNEALFLQQFAHQFERYPLVSQGLNQDIQHLSLAIDSTPQIHALAIDGDKQLIKVPSRIWSRSRTSKLVCISQPELHRPAPHALIGDIYAVLGQHIFNIAKAEGNPEIQLNGVLDD